MDQSPSGPQECIFMAQLALFNEGIPEHFPIYGQSQGFYDG